MKLRWLVHSGAESFGPWSASEIREQLRMGKIDAFDLVSLYNSTDRTPIYDVPALFDSYSEKTLENEISKMSPPDKVKLASGEINDVQAYPRANAGPTQLSLPQEELSLAINLGHQVSPIPPIKAVLPQRSNQIDAAAALVSQVGGARPKPADNPPPPTNVTKMDQKRKSGVRQYFLRAPGERAKGPFSSRDIMLLWYGQKLRPEFTVQKIGGSARINIRKFISCYEKANVSSVAFLGQGHLASSREQKFFRWLVAPLLVISIVLAGTFIWQKKYPNNQDLLANLREHVLKLSNSAGQNEGQNEGQSAGQNAGNTDLNVDTLQASAPTPAKKPLAKIKIKLPSMGQRSKIKDPSMHYWHPKYIAPAPASLQVAQPPKPAPKTARFKPVADTKLNTKLLTPKAPAVKPIAAAPRAVARPPNAPTSTPWSNGANVTLPGYRYNAAALTACAAKCKIPMTGPKGPIIAIFFKEAFAKELLGNKTSVTLGGTVKLDPRGGPPLIYVQTMQ